MIITGIEDDPAIAVYKTKLMGSLLFFIQNMFHAYTGNNFNISNPFGRESHHITISRSLTRSFRLETNRLIINIPPGHGKSTFLQYFVAWAWTHYPDAKFLYISYSHDEASKNTSAIRNIVSLPVYKKLFGVSIDQSSSAKDDFKTIQGGALKAFGSSGSVTGKDAGLPGMNRFTGMLIMDDMHKPDEVHSYSIREGVIKNYQETIAQRVRGPNVPQVYVGQRLHEDDLSSYFTKSGDGYEWEKVVLKGLDENENALDENVKTKEQLLLMKKYMPYVYYAQYQQTPQPTGGGIFKKDDFVLLDSDPDFIATFITADTAETSKTFNDASAFSFWGLYKINNSVDFGEGDHDIGLHCITCYEIRVEPKDLKDEFIAFYTDCCRYKTRPSFVAIEKKSTGVTLLSVLSEIRGLSVRGIDRNRSDGDKIRRYLQIQPYIASKLVSLTAGAKHVDLFIDHCARITANDTHSHDDIADTLFDAVSIGLINKAVQNQYIVTKTGADPVSNILQKMTRMNTLRESAWRRY